jgi:uncharacterized membrane protein
MEEVTAMQDFEQSETINAPADRVFDFISEVNNFPQYLPTVQKAEAVGADRVRLQGEAGGRKYDDTGYFEADKPSRRMEWKSDDGSGYHGWLQVSPGYKDSCEVTVHLSFNTDSQAMREMDKGAGHHEQAMNDGIEKTLQSIKRLCEGRGRKKGAAGQG